MRKGFFIIILIFIGFEIFSRFFLGLGTPPLFETDAALEYRLKPNQSLYRFGNYFETNELGMRSPTLKQENRKIIMVLGDSVVYGGGQISQENLATSLISDDEIVFANFSAPSWGPANILAALNEVSDIDMQGIVVVLNSDDIFDVPSFRPLGIDQPEFNPYFAVWEATTRYIPRYFNFLKINNITDVDAEFLESEGRSYLYALLKYLKYSKAPVCVVIHPKKSEIISQNSKQYFALLDIIYQNNVMHINATDLLIGSADLFYLDDIHLSKMGQKWLAHSILECSKNFIQNFYNTTNLTSHY